MPSRSSNQEHRLQHWRAEAPDSCWVQSFDSIKKTQTISVFILATILSKIKKSQILWRTEHFDLPEANVSL